MTPIEQLEEWVKGSSIHNEERDECCPDFSCCNKMVETPVEAKQRFVKAFQENDGYVINQMLMFFLGNAFPNAHIVGE